MNGQMHDWMGWACFQSGWLLQEETEPVGAMHAAAVVTSSSIRLTLAADVDGVIAAALDVAPLQGAADAMEHLISPPWLQAHAW